LIEKEAEGTTQMFSTQFSPIVVAGAALVGLTACYLFLSSSSSDVRPYIHVAFVGNSMQYYNDLPRFMEALSDYHLTQNSCLHGDANLESILNTGNGMYSIWKTGSARVFNYDKNIHDFGACTVRQLLFGYDEALEERVTTGEYNDDSFTNDGKNPCLEDEQYYYYLQQQVFADTSNKTTDYEYIILNDNTRSPARATTRSSSLEVLEEAWAQWFVDTGATPIFISTYAYDTPYRDMGGLGTIAEFTSLTYQGYLEYAALLEELLPTSQKPRIAPVGHAFLLVYEENYQLWQKLFSVDKIHPSPLGTFLQGCVLYHTLFGKMPVSSVAVRSDMSALWTEARRFQPGSNRRSPFPTQEEAAYLYHIAARVTRYGELPTTLIRYQNNEAADYEPQDDLYRIDDIF
jgi:hypothetical protein